MKAEKNAWSVGLKVKEKRKCRGLTQRDLTDATGLSEQFISNLEPGQRHPGTKTLRAVAGVLKIQPAVLFSGMSSTRNPLDLVLAKLGSPKKRR